MVWVLVVGGTVVLTTLVVLFLSNVSSSEKKIEYEVEAVYGVRDDQFIRSMGSLLQPGMLPGNRVTILSNGREIFPEIFAAVRQAKKTITFETFIYWEGRVGRALAEALAERARAGVAVHVLLDWLGAAKIDTEYLSLMEKAGVEVERYHPLNWYTLDRINNRTHRKLMVVDGVVGFTGGVGIADKWDGDAEDPEHWRDLHFRVEGPAVAQLQSAFMDNWVKIRSRVLHTGDYFPELAPAGEQLAQVFSSSPREGGESMRLMFLMSIGCAQKTLRIGNAYFVPDDLLVRSLCDACKRGVHVQIVVPNRHIDVPMVRHASRARWGDLLQAGCEIYEFQPTMYHTKLMIVDGCWSSVGSTNFDNRSLRLNDEANLNVWDEPFAAQLQEQFDEDLRRSKRITCEAWKQRPLREKLIEHFAALFRSQL